MSVCLRKCFYKVILYFLLLSVLLPCVECRFCLFNTDSCPNFDHAQLRTNVFTLSITSSPRSLFSISNDYTLIHFTTFILKFTLLILLNLVWAHRWVQ